MNAAARAYAKVPKADPTASSSIQVDDVYMGYPADNVTECDYGRETKTWPVGETLEEEGMLM